MKKILTNKQKALIRKGFLKGNNFTDQRAEFLLPKKIHPVGSAKNCLVIDGMNIAYQAFYAYAKLSYQGKSTAILYGFINILRPIIQEYNPEKVIICWDGCKHPERMSCLPEYKSHREIGRNPKHRKRFLNQIKRLRKLLYYLGIPQAYDCQIEGDDMIYLVHKKMKSMYRIIIISEDKDFKQLIDHDTSVYNPRSKYIETLWAFTANNYGIEVPQYKDFLCLIGDKSDDIPGYPGIGEKRAASLLGKYYTIKDYLNSNEDIAGLTDKDKLRKIYLRNNKMINLRYFNRKFLKKVNVLYYNNEQWPKYQVDNYRNFCIKFGLKTSIFPKFLEPYIKLSI